jgi:hypothetical protein
MLHVRTCSVICIGVWFGLLCQAVPSVESMVALVLAVQLLQVRGVLWKCVCLMQLL